MEEDKTTLIDMVERMKSIADEEEEEETEDEWLEIEDEDLCEEDTDPMFIIPPLPRVR